MTAMPFSFPIFKALTTTGTLGPLAGGLLHTFEAGTSTPLAVYQDDALTTPHTNPVVLDSNGQATIYLGPNAYKMRLEDSTGAVQPGWPIDGIEDPLSASEAYTDTLRADLAASSGSSLVGFIQSGTGAVARTAQDKGREWVSVKDFGAVGDGVTDDTAAIQAAIAYAWASSLTPRVLFVPTGEYIVTSTLNFGAYGYFIGETRRSIITFNHSDTGVAIAGGTGRIEKIHFKRHSGYARQGVNVYQNAAYEWKFDAVRFSAGLVGLKTKDSHLCTYDSCVFGDNTTGLLDEGRCFATTLINSQFYANDYGCDIKSEHTFIGGAIELSIYNDAMVNVTADYQGIYRAKAQFYGVHFEAKDGLAASTDPNLLVGPASSGANTIQVACHGCSFNGNSSNRPAISLRRAAAVNIMAPQIKGYGTPTAGIVSTSDTGRLVTASVYSTLGTTYSISTATRWTSLDGENVLCRTLSIRDPMPAAPAAVSGAATIYIDPADNDLKVIFGDGTVKTIVVDT